MPDTGIIGESDQRGSPALDLARELIKIAKELEAKLEADSAD